MNPRDRVIKTLRFESVDRAPRDLWYLPGVEMFRKNELDEVLQEFPPDFASPRYRYGKSRRARGIPNVIGEYVDAWGSVWTVAEPGVIGEVKAPPLADWSALDSYTPPWELLEEADLSEVNRSCAETDRFVKVGTETRPFERMQFLRGTENLFLDLAYGTKEVYRLRDMLHEFFIREMEMWAKTDVDAVAFMDDWGAQKALLISPELWRSFFKPLYKDYCDILHSAGKFVFFHSDGNIEVIYPDLIEIGISALNSQLFCMNIEELGRKYGGKITFWGEIDRQKILPFGSTDEVRQAVRRVRRALDTGHGGVIAQCEWGVKDPKENIRAVFDEWLKRKEHAAGNE
ncbi:MAG: methyltransferase [Firmicutes bacterium]|nr:methyltransferase [Bacillota bacterium]